MSDLRRWRAAQGKERVWRERRRLTPEILQNIKQLYLSLLRTLPEEIRFEGKRILEVGGAGTSIFLALSKGERYAADPLVEYIFELNPFLEHLDEYKGVNFISKPIEDLAFDYKFDIIFMINVLDHMGNLKVVADKIGQLISPGGYLIIAVDCYADTFVRNVMRFFDVDLPHPHHFSKSDVIAMFSRYRLIKYDDRMFEVVEDFTPEESPKAYQPHRLLRRALRNIDLVGERNIFYIVKYFMCYTICLLIASVRRIESPIFPLKKRRLFVFVQE